jgi:hypothetical protein
MIKFIVPYCSLQLQKLELIQKIYIWLLIQVLAIISDSNNYT